MKNQAALWTLTLGVAATCMAAGAGIYQTATEVPNWSAAMPQSVLEYRSCFSHAHPGHFFQVVAPIAMIAVVAALALGARDPWAVACLGLMIATALFTVIYFLPRNSILFFGETPTPGELMVAAGKEWVFAQYIRVAMLVAAMVSGLKAMVRVAREGAP